MNFIDANFDIDQALTEWKAEKIAEKFYAKWHAGVTTDADVGEYHNATAETTQATAETAQATAEAKYAEAAADYAACNINPTAPGETFGIAWGADGEVLTYEQTIEAIATRKGWYDWQGHWVNMAAQEKRLSMRLIAADIK